MPVSGQDPMKISKEKRDQLILVGLITISVLVGLWLGLVGMEKTWLEDIAARKGDAAGKRAKVEQAIKDKAKVEALLSMDGKRLADMEDGMASGSDLYSWMWTRIRTFKLGYRVDIPQFSQPDVKDMTLLPEFPYKQTTMTIGGTAYYQDFGKFLADFENHFPYFRVLNLDLSPVSGLVSTDKEKLTFRMDVVALIKPAS
jgi:hypothetical protein